MFAPYAYPNIRHLSQLDRAECISCEKEPWDMRASGISVQEADPFGVMLAMQQGFAARRIPFFCDDAPSALTNLGLSRGGMLTNAAALLFHRFEDALILCRAYDSPRCDVLIEGADCSGSFSTALEEARAFLERHAPRALAIQRENAHEKESCIACALGEALVNALAHRDYEIAEPVRAVVSPGCVRISSPGPYLFDVYVPSPRKEGAAETLRDRPAAGAMPTRNALLVQALYRFGGVDARGSGMPLIVSTCSYCGLRVSWSNENGHAVIAFEPADE
ncbi:hypothetical protein DMP07_00960 [Slackia faecicanis]|uniref:ATP-dependent DNA helicase RecG C-terminal domain-containing protein n=1 Tax=Slackia faecicanis TaxID=255723 RepID=A0A3N0AI15_9ACTN|nr:hypothetical protein [Slackia faecicanis]RNL21450.1 hypothetical protein DMP07_00960 [Slackia faecicanis]